MIKLHFINGHTYNNQGASSYESDGVKLLKITEWDYAHSLHRRLSDTIVKHGNAYNFKYNIVTSTDLALEFHLNSFNSPTIEGYEVLVMDKDLESLEYAQLFLSLMKIHFPLRRNRGIKLITPNDRGYNNLLRLKQFYNKAILTEAFFLNNPDEWIDRADMANVINALDITIKQGEF